MYIYIHMYIMGCSPTSIEWQELNQLRRTTKTDSTATKQGLACNNPTSPSILTIEQCSKPLLMMWEKKRPNIIVFWIVNPLPESLLIRHYFQWWQDGFFFHCSTGNHLSGGQSNDIQRQWWLTLGDKPQDHGDVATRNRDEGGYGGNMWK